MGLFDFFKSNPKKPSIDLQDFKFLSNDHTRFENGLPIMVDNSGAWRGIRVKTNDNNSFFVTMYNMNGNHPIWGNNIQMAEKQMKIIEDDERKIVLRGFGVDLMGASFADYGLTLHKAKGSVNKVTLHMHDRQIDILYELAPNSSQPQSPNVITDFDRFKAFVDKWNTSMGMQEKMQIAMQSDAINNQGSEHHEVGNIGGAIEYFEKALIIMPNNDDALKNLIICYKEIGNYSKVNDLKEKLDYLS
jgi:tetratricopeptide (TPR) repeat protein